MRLFHVVVCLSLLIALAQNAMAQESERPLPAVAQLTEPVYPPLAIQSRIQGEVWVTFTTNGETVVSVESQAGPPSLLRESAEDSVKTWKFVPHDPGTFTVTLRYTLADGRRTVFLPPFKVVEITEFPPQQEAVCANSELQGKWKAQLRGPRGNSQEVFELDTSCPDTDSLVGDVLGSGEQFDYGYYDEDRKMLGFMVMLNGGKKQHLSTSFVGKFGGNGIRGTFLDETGTTGAWTAIRQK